MKNGINYKVKRFKVVDSEKQIVEVTYDNEGIEATIEVSYTARIDGYVTNKNRNTLFDSYQVQLTEPNQIRFSKDLDYDIRVALNK